VQSLLFQGLFYVTPIIFSSSMLEERGFGMVCRLNPFYYIIEIVKIPLLGESAPKGGCYVGAIAITAALFFFSICLIMKTRKGIAFQL